MPRKRTTVARICQGCGVTFQARTDGAGLYCSRDCWRNHVIASPEQQAAKRERDNARHRVYYAENRARWKARLEDPNVRERARESRRRSWARHRDRLLPLMRQRNAETLEQRRAYFAANKARYAALMRAWRRRNPDHYAALKSKSVAIKFGLTEHFTSVQWRDLKTAHRHTCLRCGRREPAIKLTVDHVIPMRLGGTNTIDNIQPLCVPCNSAKHTRTTDYRVPMVHLHTAQ